MSQRYHLIKFGQLCAFPHSRLRAKNGFSLQLPYIWLPSAVVQLIPPYFLSWCPLISVTAAHWTLSPDARGIDTRLLFHSPPFFSPFWERPLTAESFWISAIMFSLCNPPHGKIDLSTFAAASLPFYRHHSPPHSRLQMYRISPQKPLEGAQ